MLSTSNTNVRHRSVVPTVLDQRRRSRGIVLSTCLFASIAATVASCQSMSGGTTVPASTANINAFFSSPDQGAPTCTGSFTWTYELLGSGQGSAGTAGPVSHNPTYSLPSDVSNQCVYRDGTLGLRPGMWQVSVLNFTCQILLSAGQGPSMKMNTCSRSG